MWNVTHLLGRYFEIDNDWSERGFGELGGMVDGVAVEHDQLQRSRQLEDPLDLGLNLSCRKRRVHVASQSFSLFDQEPTVFRHVPMQQCKEYEPIQEDRELDRSMMARLLGLLSSERFASEMSAVTRVIVILGKENSTTSEFTFKSKE